MNCKRNSLVVEDKMLLITTVRFEGAYVTWNCVCEVREVCGST
jgi:hypothetical protein